MEHQLIIWSSLIITAFIILCTLTYLSRIETMDKENRILEALGNNHTDPCVIESDVIEEDFAVYTYEGDVYVLQDGADFEFSELSEEDQTLAVNKIEAKDYEINASYQ